MPERRFSAENGYRYGFNGKENDNEVKEDGNQQDYGMRIYDPRLGRFLSVDPLSNSFSMLTPYQFSSNSPIANIDLDGAESKYYTIEISGTINGKGKLVTSTSKVIEEKNKAAGWFVNGKLYNEPGPLGEGTYYRIIRAKTILNDDGSEQTIIENVGAIYVPPPPKPSPNRPMNSSLLNIIVWGGGHDPDAAPGSKANPKGRTITFNFQDFNEIMEPILLGQIDKYPGRLDLPNLHHIILSNGEFQIEKAIESYKAEWNKQIDANSIVLPPGSDSCMACNAMAPAYQLKNHDFTVSTKTANKVDTSKKVTKKIEKPKK